LIEYAFFPPPARTFFIDFVTTKGPVEVIMVVSEEPLPVLKCARRKGQRCCGFVLELRDVCGCEAEMA
jgi:hypothetical protein